MEFLCKKRKKKVLLQQKDIKVNITKDEHPDYFFFSLGALLLIIGVLLYFCIVSVDPLTDAHLLLFPTPKSS